MNVFANHGGAKLTYRRMYLRREDIEAAQAIALFTVHGYSHAPAPVIRLNLTNRVGQKSLKRARVKTGRLHHKVKPTRQPDA